VSAEVESKFGGVCRGGVSGEERSLRVPCHASGESWAGSREASAMSGNWTMLG